MSGTETSPPKEQFLVALVDGKKVAFPKERVREVLRRGEVTPIPGSPEGVLGLMNLRGESLPVISVALRVRNVRRGLSENSADRDQESFSTPETSAAKGILLLSRQEHPVGFLVDGVQGMRLGTPEYPPQSENLQNPEHPGRVETLDLLEADEDGREWSSKFLQGVASIEEEGTLPVLNLSRLSEFPEHSLRDVRTPLLKTAGMPAETRRPLRSLEESDHAEAFRKIQVFALKSGKMWLGFEPSEVEQVLRLPVIIKTKSNDPEARWVKFGRKQLLLLDPASLLEQKTTVSETDKPKEPERPERTALVLILKHQKTGTSAAKQIAVRSDRIRGFLRLSKEQFKPKPAHFPVWVRQTAEWQGRELLLADAEELMKELKI